MDAAILSIGNELTLGQTVDTNTAWLAQQLAAIGITIRLHVTIADELEPIRREIDRACDLVDVILITGGIGPTEDDLTRHALAAVLGVGLTRREACVQQIEAFFRSRGRPMPEANVIQAMLPEGTEAIENTCGTAPGIRARWKRASIFVMPGVPREMKVMYERSVLPHLRAHTGQSVILARTLYCFGAGESEIGERIRDLMQRGRNPTVGTTAQQAVIGVRIHSHGNTRAEAEQLLRATGEEVCHRLGTLVFGTDAPARAEAGQQDSQPGELAGSTLQDAVARLLFARGLTIATAESCTGGLLAGRLTDVPGSSVYMVQGVITYSNEAKTRLLSVPPELIATHGAVSEPVASAMAVSCRLLAGTDLAVSITGIAGPSGGTPAKPVGLVYIGLADHAGCTVTEHRLGETLTREEVRDRTCKTALNRLRLYLLEHPPRTSGQRP